MEIDKKVSKEMKQIKEEIDDPYIESLPTSIMENKGVVKKKAFKQFRVAIPKKFADLIKLNKEDFQAEISLNKEENKLEISISKK